MPYQLMSEGMTGWMERPSVRLSMPVRLCLVDASPDNATQTQLKQVIEVTFGQN